MTDYKCLSNVKLIPDSHKWFSIFLLSKSGNGLGHASLSSLIIVE